MGRSLSRSWLPLNSSFTSDSLHRIHLMFCLTSVSAYGFDPELAEALADAEAEPVGLETRLQLEAEQAVELVVRA